MSGVSEGGTVVCRYETSFSPGQDTGGKILAKLNDVQGTSPSPQYNDRELLDTLCRLTREGGIGWRRDSVARTHDYPMPHAPIPKRFADFVADPTITQTFYAERREREDEYILRGLLERCPGGSPAVFFQVSKRMLDGSTSCVVALRYQLRSELPLSQVFDLCSDFMVKGPRWFLGEMDTELARQEESVKLAQLKEKDAVEGIRGGEISDQFPCRAVTIADGLEICFQTVADSAIILVKRDAEECRWQHGWVVSGPNLVHSQLYAEFSGVFGRIERMIPSLKLKEVSELLQKLGEMKSDVVCRDEWMGDVSDVVGFGNTQLLEEGGSGAFSVEMYTPVTNDDRLRRILFGYRGCVLRLADPLVNVRYPGVFSSLELDTSASGYALVTARNQFGGEMRLVARYGILSPHLPEILDRFAHQIDMVPGALRTALEEVAREEEAAVPEGRPITTARFRTNVPAPGSIGFSAYSSALELGRVCAELAEIDERPECKVTCEPGRDSCTFSLGRHLDPYRFTLHISDNAVVKMHVSREIPNRSFTFNVSCNLPVERESRPDGRIYEALSRYLAFWKQPSKNLLDSEFLRFLQENFEER